MLTDFYKRLHPSRTVNAVGIALGIKGNAAPVAVGNAVLAGVICQVISGI